MNNESILAKIKKPMILEFLILTPHIISIFTNNFIGIYLEKTFGCLSLFDFENCAMEMEILSMILISFVFSSWTARILIEHVNSNNKTNIEQR